MKRRISFFLLLYLCSTVFVNAQSESKLDVIHLKNKKVYYGTILSNEFGIIKMQTTNDEGKEVIITVQRFEVKSIEKNQDPKKIKEQSMPATTLSPDDNSNVDPTGLKQSDDSNLFLERQVVNKYDPTPIFTDKPIFKTNLTKKGGAGAAD